MSQIIPQFIIVLNDQQALQVLVVLLFRLFINLGRRHVGHLLCAEFTGTGCQVCFMKCLSVLPKTYFDRRSLMFHAAQIDFTFVQMNQFPYKHESDTTSGYFRVDRIASPEMYFK